MTVSVPIADSHVIETYSGLQDFIENHLELDSETVAQLPTLIRLAEYRLDRMLTTPQRETSESVGTTASIAFVSLPTYLRQLDHAYIDGDYPLERVSLNTLHGEYGETSGKPKVYAISEGEMWLGPLPDGEYEIRLTYLTRLDPLSVTNTSNWLLRQHADAYVCAVVAQVESFRDNDERASRYWGLVTELIGEINAQGNRFRNTEPIRLRSSVVV